MNNPWFPLTATLFAIVMIANRWSALACVSTLPQLHLLAKLKRSKA